MPLNPLTDEERTKQFLNENHVMKDNFGLFIKMYNYFKKNVEIYNLLCKLKYKKPMLVSECIKV